MRLVYSLTALLFTLLLSTQTYSQNFDGQWSCAYATTDDDANGTGQRTMAVAALGNNKFVALINRTSRDAYYLVGYDNADSVNGRLGKIPYSKQGFKTLWSNVFDQVVLNNPLGIARYQDANGPTNIVVVTNNDEDHSLLKFELKEDSIYTYPQRLKTGSDSIWAVDVDGNGNVFVTTQGDSTTPAKILVFGNPDTESGWTSGTHESANGPLFTINLPDPGTARGIAVNSDATVIYVSNYEAAKIYCYVGDLQNGYSLYSGFNFQIDKIYQSKVDTSAAGSFEVGPWGLKFMNGNNILFAAAAANFHTGTGYEYSRIYAVNPNTGEIMDTIDVAEWNYAVTGAYNNRTNNIASGYSSTYSVDYDQDKNLYSQSYYGWTVEKWVYSGTLPTISLTITSVGKSNETIPSNFTLSQNYPNPFNPTTMIKFSLPERANITLSVYTITGQLVKTLAKGNYAAGNYKVAFDASGLSSGTYIYRISNGISTIAKKMIVLK
jgi:hypothetical protein